MLGRLELTPTTCNHGCSAGDGRVIANRELISNIITASFGQNHRFTPSRLSLCHIKGPHRVRSSSFLHLAKTIPTTIGFLNHLELDLNPLPILVLHHRVPNLRDRIVAGMVLLGDPSAFDLVDEAVDEVSDEGRRAVSPDGLSAVEKAGVHLWRVGVWVRHSDR